MSESLGHEVVYVAFLSLLEFLKFFFFFVFFFKYTNVSFKCCILAQSKESAIGNHI